MSTQGARAAALSERALREAAEWRVQLANPHAGEADRRVFDGWLCADPEHAQAWREIEATWGVLSGLEDPSARAALDRAFREERREARRLLGRGASVLLLVLALLPALWLGLGTRSPGYLLADHHTAIGERRTLILADGSRLVLDTATAVDVRFDDTLRQIRLRQGQVFIDVAPDSGRPLEVVTAEARVRALGTRFSVRRAGGAEAGTTRVAVYESRVELCPAVDASACQRLEIGQRADASRARVGALQALTARGAPGWITGYLEVEDLPVAEVLAELARYHRGLLYYDASALGDLTFSGTLPLGQTERALHALANTLPIRVGRYGPWVITVRPAR
jgi:transmembrane sensor